MKQSDAIGIFDSGLGGISMLCTLSKFLPKERYIYYGDCVNAPYGVKTREEITKRCFAICERLIEQGVKAIVVACNTATSACVKELRATYPHLPIIGMEPALKPAVEAKNHQNVLVLATPFTLREQKFTDLMSRYDHQHHIYRQPCPKLVTLMESGDYQDPSKVDEALMEYLSPYQDHDIHSIVLGCTHFVFLKQRIMELCGTHVNVIDGNMGTARQVKTLLEQHDLLSDEDQHEVIFDQQSLTAKTAQLAEELYKHYR